MFGSILVYFENTYSYPNICLILKDNIIKKAANNWCDEAKIIGASATKVNTPSMTCKNTIKRKYRI